MSTDSEIIRRTFCSLYYGECHRCPLNRSNRVKKFGIKNLQKWPCDDFAIRRPNDVIKISIMWNCSRSVDAHKRYNKVFKKQKRRIKISDKRTYIGVQFG